MREEHERGDEPGVVVPALRRSVGTAMALAVFVPGIAAMLGIATDFLFFWVLVGFVSGIGTFPIWLIEILTARRARSFGRDLLAGALGAGIAFLILCMAVLQIVYFREAVVLGGGVGVGLEAAEYLFRRVVEDDPYRLAVLLVIVSAVVPLLLVRLHATPLYRQLISVVGISALELAIWAHVCFAGEKTPKQVAELFAMTWISATALVLSFAVGERLDRYLATRNARET